MLAYKDVFFDICLDLSTIAFSASEIGTIFAQTNIVYNKLIEIASRNKVMYNVINDSINMKCSEDITYLKNQLFKLPYSKYDGESDNIKVYITKNQYTEVKNIAEGILNSIKSDDNIHFDDFIIYSNNVEMYVNIFEKVFREYKIPIYSTTMTDVSSHPLAIYVVSLINIVNQDFAYSDIFAFLKTGLFNIDTIDIDYIENYVLEYGIKGNNWLQVWEIGDKEYNLDRLNRIRSSIVAAISDFQVSLCGKKTACEISAIIYSFLENSKVINKILIEIEKLETINDLVSAKIYKYVYKKIIQTLDDMAILFKEEKIPFDKYKEILNISLQEIKVNTSERLFDQVILSDISNSKHANRKMVYIIGFNEGVFPKSVKQNNGLFSDNELYEFKSTNLDIEFNELNSIYNDLFNIYAAIASSEYKICFTVPVSNISGNNLMPSSYIHNAKNIFQGLKYISDVAGDSRFDSRGTFSVNNTISDLLINMREFSNDKLIAKEWSYIYDCFKGSKKYADTEVLFKMLNEKSPIVKIEEKLANEIYTDTMKTSVSRLELYSKCPFSHFMQYTLNLKERRIHKLTNIDIGNLLHHIIDEFMQHVMKNHITWNNLLENDKYLQIIDNIVSCEITSSSIWESNNKSKNLRNRLVKAVRNVIYAIIYHYINSDIEIYGTELAFGDEGQFEPMIINLDNNKKVIIRGKIDRVDIVKHKKEGYIQIIDFKSSSKDIRLNDVYDGLQLQLFTYMNAIINQDKISKDMSLDMVYPAGLFYFKMDNPIISTKTDILDNEQIKQMILAQFKLKGLAIDNIDILTKMDNNIEDNTKKCIDITPGRSKSRLLNRDLFIKECDNIKLIIASISNKILSGDASVKPNKKVKPCSYCKYSSICGGKIK